MAADKKKKPLTCVFFIGDKQVEKLDHEHVQRISQRLSTEMSDYFSRHPEEYTAFCRSGNKK